MLQKSLDGHDGQTDRQMNGQTDKVITIEIPPLQLQGPYYEYSSNLGSKFWQRAIFSVKLGDNTFVIE